MPNTPSTLPPMDASEVANEPKVANEPESDIKNRLKNFVRVIESSVESLKNLRAFDSKPIKKSLLNYPIIRLNDYLEQARITRMSIGDVFNKLDQVRCAIPNSSLRPNKTETSVDLVIDQFFIVLKDCHETINDLFKESSEGIKAELNDHQSEYPLLKDLLGYLTCIENEIDFLQRLFCQTDCSTPKKKKVAKKTPKKQVAEPKPEPVKAEEVKPISDQSATSTKSEVVNLFCELYRFPESPVYKIDKKYKLAYSKLMDYELFIVDKNQHEKQNYQALYKILKKGRRVKNAVIVAVKGKSDSMPITFYLIPKEVLTEVKRNDASAITKPKSAIKKELAKKARALRERIEENEAIFENDLEYKIAHIITEHMEDGNRGYTYGKLAEVFDGQIIPIIKLAEHLKNLKETLETIGIELKGNLMQGGLKKIRLEWVKPGSKKRRY